MNPIGGTKVELYVGGVTTEENGSTVTAESQEVGNRK
jgi:hypothetical protein